MADNVSAIPYGTAALGQYLIATGASSANWAYSTLDQTTVTAAAGGNAGTSPPAPAVNSSSTITRGSATCGTGSGAATGTLVTVTFGSTLPSVPFVTISPTTSALAALSPAVTGVSTTGFSVLATSPSSSQANTVYGFGWFVSM